MKVGLFGTGLLGSAMARRLLARGVSLTVWNRTRRKLAPLVEAGATAAATPAEALRSCDAVALLLADAHAIRETLLTDEARPALSGRTILQMGTIASAESLALAEEVRAAGGDWMEAPVLGSLPQAADGSLIVIVGGTKEQLERWAPLLAHWGPPPVFAGPVGSAAVVKLALNQLIASLTVAFSQSLALVRRSGLDVEAFLGILRRSALYAPTFDKKLPGMMSGDFGRPNFPVRHLLKDVDLFLSEAKARGLRVSGVEGVCETIAAALEAGLIDVDYSAVYAAVDPGEKASS